MQKKYVYTCMLPPPLFLIPLSCVCVSAAEGRHGSRFRRSSAEEAAGGGGFVQPGPLSLHFHPGPGSQDPRSAPTAQELRQTNTNTKTGQDLNNEFRME